ncbi:MAG: molybdopterin-dependent oxidoreductase [Marinovum sp.]|nr:molybdopterin-dependent oxidoreductase [Marinovum sp.]
MNRITLISVWAALCLAVVAAFVGSRTMAQESSVAPSQGPVVLEISGRIMASAPEQSFVFDIAGLEGLGTTDILTETPWTTGVVTFTGVRLRDILNAVDAQGSAVMATALNDYSITIPKEDSDMYDVIVATRQDGRLMTVRDRGPLWVIYPWSDRSELRNEVYYARSIWQLMSLEVLE